MKLKIIQQKSPTHKGVVSSLSWSKNHELYSCGDDKCIYKWNSNGEIISKVVELKSFITCIDWFPSLNKLNRSEIFAVGCADGSYMLCNESGRIEKTVKAHNGAVVSIKWTYEGTALCTGGEDGNIMLWSRGGTLRSKIASAGKCIYSISFNSTSEKILYCCGKDLVIKKLHSSSKQRQWKAHDGVILNVDWSPVSGLIASSGEEGFFKIWDKFGRVLFKSSFFNYTITSLSWSPNGNHLAVGSFGQIKICNRNGYCEIRQELERIGSPFSIAWSSDSTEFSCGGGTGSIVFAKIIEKQLEWNNYIVSLVDVQKLKIYNLLTENVSDELDFRDKILIMSFEFDQLIVITTAQCFIYNIKQINSPHVFDIKDTINLIVQSKRVFLLCSNFGGINVYSYKGKHVSKPKISDIKTEFLNKTSISLSNDILAIIDKSAKKKSKEILLFNVNSGKPVFQPIKHNMKIKEIALSQFSPSYVHRKGKKKSSAHQRLIIFIDRNRDLYISTIKDQAIFKLSTMVDSIHWNNRTDVLISISDSKLICWYYPNIIYIDRDLLDSTKTVKDVNLGKRSSILSFIDSRCRIKLWKGTILNFTVDYYPLLLYELIAKHKYEEAIQLCRFVKDKSMWSCLAAMSIKNAELNTAEVALAAIEQVDKLQFILHVKGIPSQEGRQAELELYQRRPNQAERILIQNDLIFRAIKLNIKLYRWERALELVKKHKVHLKTVLYYRQKYNLVFNEGVENNTALFGEFKDVQFTEKEVKKAARKEKVDESKRQGASPYV